MPRRVNHSKLYRIITETLEKKSYSRKRLIANCIDALGLSREELANRSTNSQQNILRSKIGTVINEMHASGILMLDGDGKYSLVPDKPVAVRIEKCESEIIKALSARSMTKAALREHIKKALGADKTPSTKDDDKVFSYVGQLLKRLTAEGALTSDGMLYSLSPKLVARADDINAMLSLRSDFLARIHRRGGEFFENYFMALIEKYATKHGKKILECYVVGGSDDGGIDGILKTQDALGFRETIMVQTKNRVEITSETDVRGFYGAVCAKQGSRGIYAITSDFHPVAKKFLDDLDNCVGVNGDRLFSMALVCLYGIKKTDGGYALDERII
ncbi:MAG: restriction endonuclease [Clostridia bacterium]|nr:restriction endonuclease [Clostridia bacterium]